MDNSAKIAFIVNTPAFFVSHRLPLAIEALKAGFQVRLMTGTTKVDQVNRAALITLEALGISHRASKFCPAGLNPYYEMIGFIQLIWHVLRFGPDLIHCASPKGVIYGGCVARLCRVRNAVFSFSGFGFGFTESRVRSARRYLVRKTSFLLYRFILRHPRFKVVVQNDDDYHFLYKTGLVQQSNLIRIAGSGVDLSLFAGCNPEDKLRIVLFPARMLKDKGVEEFIQAAKIVKEFAPEWRFVLAGAADSENPTAVSRKQLEVWQLEENIDWLGYVVNMVPLYRQAAIVCLPSYREGMPKALLEAAAAGCAIVTTDAVGCREAVVDGKTGDLIPVGDGHSLANALLSLIQEPSRRISYGAEGRMRAQEEFSLTGVVERFMAIYRQLLFNTK